MNATGVNTEYAAANSVELSRGRFFTEEDEEKARTVAVVSDVFAETLFPGQEAIGQAFQLTVRHQGIHILYRGGVPV